VVGVSVKKGAEVQSSTSGEGSAAEPHRGEDAGSKLAIEESLKAIDEDRHALLVVAERMARAHGASLYPFDVLANGAIARSLALSKGFTELIRQRNLVCAGALVRLQLDTALRFTAGWLVDDPHDFAMKVLEGMRINKLKDRDGKDLHDRRLVESAAGEHPWVRSVYDVASDFVHLSDRHMWRAFGLADDGTQFRITVSSEDPPGLEDSYMEAIKYFRESTHLLLHYLEGWIFTKDNPSLIRQMKLDREGRT
jgi:hypothetical protein